MAHTIGDFEQLILLALVRLGLGTHTASRSAARSRNARGRRSTSSPGALYTALDRLEKRGFVSSHLGDPTPERRRQTEAALYRQASRRAGALADLRVSPPDGQRPRHTAQDRQRVDHASYEADSTATRGSTPAVERGSRGRGGYRRRSRGDDARRSAHRGLRPAPHAWYWRTGDAALPSRERSRPATRPFLNRREGRPWQPCDRISCRRFGSSESSLRSRPSR